MSLEATLIVNDYRSSEVAKVMWTGVYVNCRFVWVYVNCRNQVARVLSFVNCLPANLQELNAQKVNPNLYVFNSLMNVNACDLSYTMNIYKHMQNLGIAPDISSYNILLKSCSLAARLDLAQEIYKEVEYLESIGSLKLDVFTYSTMIKVFTDERMWQMALGIKDKMLETGVTPNIVIYNDRGIRANFYLKFENEKSDQKETFYFLFIKVMMLIKFHTAHDIESLICLAY